MRSATARLKIPLALAAAALAAAPTPGPARVTIALLPPGTTVHDIAAAGLSPGVMSAGLGSVPAAQTYLDITQGNRVFDSLYDRDLPPVRVRGGTIATWPAIVARASSAPADIVPGLLASAVGTRGLASSGAPVDRVLGADRAGRFERLHAREPAAAVRILRGAPGRPTLAPDDLLIAIEAPPPGEGERLAIGIDGRGFDGNLTSDSTRLDGYVLSTDVAPTVLEHLGIPIPEAMAGQPIRAEGDRDAAAVADLERRMSAIPDRRGAVIGISVLAWIALAGLAAAMGGSRTARAAVALLALAVVYLPLLLLAGAAVQPSEGGEQLLLLLGAPLAAAATLRLAGGWAALAIACALTVAAHAIDVVAGSPLTSFSLMGPNPGLGVRFFGIGNELEAALAPLVLLGTGAALAAWGGALDRRRAAVAFLAVALPLALIFAAGRFGADIGAAIVLPAGAAVAAALLAGGGRSRLLLAVALPLLALAAVAAADLVLGGDAHFVRSVLDAGGLADVGDVAERRLRLSARSFARSADSPFLALLAVLVALAVWQRRRIGRWLAPAPVRAAFLGAVAAVLVGTVANDSGALLLEVGAAYLLASCGFAWAQGGRRRAAAEGEPRAGV